MSATSTPTTAATTTAAGAASSTTDGGLFGTRTASPSASSTSSGGFGNGPFLGTAFGGSNPPSIYLICFVVIICLLLGISLFVATRALLLRRRLHRAWAATGYSDTFFENNPTIAALHGVQGWGAGGWGATQVRKREKKLGKRPTMWEVELPEDEAAAVALAEKEAMMLDTPSFFASSSSSSGEWEKLQPISVRILSNGNATPPAEPPLPPARVAPPSPTFMQTLRGPPVRPPAQPAFFAITEPVVLGPEQSIDALERERGAMEVSVLVRLPVAPAELEERETRRRERSATLVAGQELIDDDEGEDLPELWIATERIELL